MDRDKLGGHIDYLIPCLDPETPLDKRSDYEIVSQRTNLSDIEIIKLKSSITAHELALFEPHYCKFVPT